MKLPWMPPLQSAQGGEVDRTLLIVHLLLLTIFAGWGSYFVVALIRSRRFHRGAGDDLPPFQPRPWVPWALAGAIGAIELALLFGQEMPAWNRLRVAPPAGPGVVTIRIVAEQFAWNVHHPGPDGLFGRCDRALVDPANPIGLDRRDPAGADDIVTINELHLPVGRPASLELSSKDVIHSFFLPVMRVKQDVIPGQMSRAWFTPTVADTSEIACAQLCGLGHYRMKGQLIVHEPGGYERWVMEHQGR